MESFLKMQWFALPLLFVSSSFAQLTSWGDCPAVTSMTNFVPASYMGLWYESYRSFAIFEAGAVCVTATYTLNDNGTVTVENSATSVLVGSSSITGIATIVGDSDNGVLSVKFSSLPFVAPYQVLDTDYTNWASVFSCTKFGLFNFQFYWILTREQNPSTSILDEAFAVYTTNGLSTKYLNPTNQTGCSA